MKRLRFLQSKRSGDGLIFISGIVLLVAVVAVIIVGLMYENYSTVSVSDGHLTVQTYCKGLPLTVTGSNVTLVSQGVFPNSTTWVSYNNHQYSHAQIAKTGTYPNGTKWLTVNVPIFKNGTIINGWVC